MPDGALKWMYTDWDWTGGGWTSELEYSTRLTFSPKKN